MNTNHMTMLVQERRTIAEGVVLLTLTDPDGNDLPDWRPGAHIDLHVGNAVRQYSLCSSPTDTRHYQVAVLLDPASRGGSSYVHQHVAQGSHVGVSAPRNNFELRPARKYIFIAGGIGITPIKPMLAAAAENNAEWTLLYGGRTRSSMAFADELVDTWGPRVNVQPHDERGLLDVRALLATPTPDTLIYCCGPERLLDAVRDACTAWAPDALRVERFTPETRNADEASGPFEVHFAQSERTVTVTPDQSILHVAEDAGIPVVYSCQEGTCGSCELKVLAGVPDHRDSVLDEAERASNDRMMICVSRSKTQTLVLDA